MSYSGSSLLGFVLGAPPEVWNLGEVKVYPRVHKLGRICTCKKATLDCPYWGELYKKDLSVFNKGSFVARIGLIIRILLNLPVQKRRASSDYQMLHEALIHSRNFEPTSEVLVDTSKSLWRLNHLMADPNIDLKVLYLKRRMKENVSSYIKHGHSFLKAVSEYFIFHKLSKKWIKKNLIPQAWIEIQHEDLANKEQRTIDQIAEFMGLDYSDYKERLKEKEFHIRTGNPRTVDQFREGFEGFFYENNWQNTLSPRKIKWVDRIAKYIG